MRLPFRKMGIFSFRKKDKKNKEASAFPAKNGFGEKNGFHRQNGYSSSQQAPTFASADLLLHLPSSLIERIFTFVCPHTQDESYETCEQSALENSCMLCDLRDLGHCAQVCKKWRSSARKLMSVAVPSTS